MIFTDPTVLSRRRVISTDGNQYSWAFALSLAIWAAKRSARTMKLGGGGAPIVCKQWRAPPTSMSVSSFRRPCLATLQRLAPFPYGDTRFQGAAKARRMPEMIAQADLDNLSRPLNPHALIMHFKPRIMKLVKMLSCYWLPSVVVMIGACQSLA